MNEKNICLKETDPVFRIFLKSRCFFFSFSFENSDDLQIHFTSGIY